MTGDYHYALWYRRTARRESHGKPWRGPSAAQHIVRSFAEDTRKSRSTELHVVLSSRAVLKVSQSDGHG
eukprot:5303992-Prymnesium_polylepis.2